ncbi:MAG: phosphotransferase family protein [Candidatus Dormibacteraeota bacterium]|nr:phosphotransferase family protein [Candidatus Dormibacteraeota bacterium]
MVTEGIRRDLEVALRERVESVETIPEGHSGFTYWVQLNGRRAVMRLPPPGARIAGPADIPRQGRLMKALHEAGLPVPDVLAMSSEAVIDGRPFYLLEAVDGLRIEQVVGTVPDRDLAASAVDVLRRMQALPLNTTGIGGEAPGTLAAEVERWTWLMERAPTELTGEAPDVAARLRATLPAEREPVLVHADFHYGNMLFRGSRVVALLDWEIAQVGQPLLDLACLSVVARSSADSPAASQVPGGGGVMVSDEELLRLYGGADRSEFEWSLALTYYKYASIFGYNLMLHRRGKRPDPVYESRTDTIQRFIAEAGGLLGGQGVAT